MINDILTWFTQVLHIQFDVYDMCFEFSAILVSK